MDSVTLSMPIPDWYRIAALVAQASHSDPDDLALERLTSFIAEALNAIQNQAHCSVGGSE